LELAPDSESVEMLVVEKSEKVFYPDLLFRSPQPRLTGGMKFFSAFVPGKQNVKSWRYSTAGTTEISAALVQPLFQIARRLVKRK